MILTEDILQAYEKSTLTFSKYLSSYVTVLNKYISVLGKASTLKNERSTLIKYVKKLRFFNDCIVRFDIREESANRNIQHLITIIGSFFIKYLEIIDLLNYFFTQSLQNEILTKTLNSKLLLPPSAIKSIEDSHNHFVKFAQWIIESINFDSSLLQLEVIQFNLRIAIEDKVDLADTDNIFLQEVIAVESEDEYVKLILQWTDILGEKVSTLNAQFHGASNQWQECVEPKKK
ncbi:hypothetical protein TBLA_0B09050 [Henningerozyma blattae CBS 6284]|uniref:RNA binding protein She2 domain-containing protein n=1 Tax=Henningerozyma blattae (strain ATCC 34711 / CBS 6284 / DSM 70876 / NBRC 10599 / NRRL Y-10934 / UCD 77-7) TaxID=1071380 RepID=I2H018_HENB6|nr:hypothetical protein TBLA_0B09050 [Tetrapisispora blattae CBS 6284]CCH59720.1 hypothetical protein TBLA_0B09050 [Tetrapisispora blattae CBS 6284]